MIPDTNTLTSLLETILSSIGAGRGFVRGQAFSLLGILAVLEILIAALWWSITGSEIIVKFLKKIMLVGFFIWVVQEWSPLLVDIMDGFVQTGSRAAARGGGSKVSIENPSAIVDAGYQAVLPIFKALMRYDNMFTIIC